MISANVVMTGSYDYGEVARSIVIAVAASYAALDLAGRVTAARGRARAAWLTGGAIAMGIGIWAMHFKGMLAFHLPVFVAYHWPTVLASLLVAIFASAVALYATSRQKMRPLEAVTGSLIMGGGIAGMHYIGMAAMRFPAITRFSPLLVTFSTFLAVVFSLVALLMAFDLREETRWTAWRRLGSAVVMGVAISAMHYTGMAAATFVSSAVSPDLSHAVSISPLGNNGIGIVTFLVLGAAILTSSMDRQAEAEVRRLNQGLEHQVAERTAQLEATNEKLRKEIAERERADEALRQSEDRLRLVIDTIPALVWSKFPDGSADFLNQRFREYTGLSVEQGLGEGWLKAIHPEDPASSVEEWRAAFAAGKSFEFEARLRRADGEYRWFLFRGEPLRTEAGKIVKWYGTTTDIEDRKQAEWVLQEAQAGLAHVARLTTMGELVGAIAHEVNQPIAAIVTNANFCLRELASATPNPDKLREAISEIVNDGTRASAVISRIRALLQKGTPKRVSVDINQIIQEVAVLLRNELARNHVSLSMDLGSDLPRVSGDGVLLQQVLINLIMNGIEAMSSIMRGLRELAIKSSRDHDEVSIQVKDSGSGFDSQQAEHIFEPFFTTKPEGIGMGLSISRSIVESHGGRLWAESGPTGAFFQFTLPANGGGVS
jgi:PAS domain S-box-containing protein